MKLIARELTYRHPGAAGPVLDQIDWESNPGTLEAVVGPNGAGKTTFIRLLSGELRPTSGAVRLNDTAVADWDARALARKRALLSQSPRLAFDFSVREVVLMGRAPHFGYAEGAEDAAVLERLLAETDLTDLADRSFPNLSRGEKQRVQLARALAQIEGSSAAPLDAVLLLDEPVNHLDLAHQQMTLQVARERAQRGATVIIVLHDLNLALRHADTVTILNRAGVAHRGPPDAVLSPGTVDSIFGVRCERWVGQDGRANLAVIGSSAALRRPVKAHNGAS